MKNITSYGNKKAGKIHSVFLFTLLVCLSIPSILKAQTYSSPIVITQGGTYSGNWESKNSEIPAVEVRTADPVIIENSNIRGAGYLIKSWGHHANITVRNTNGYGIAPTPWNSYMKPRRFLALDVFKNAVIENCYMENTAGIYLGVNYTGNNTTANTVKIRYNKVKNIDGRVHGGKDRVQFVQFNFKGAIKNVEIAWNQVINEPGNSAVEDNINMFNTQGTSDSPIRIHNNFIKGAYPIPATGTGYTGGGIISDTNADLATATKHIDASENHLVNLGNYSMGIAGGNNIRYHHNRAVNSALFGDGSRFSMYTSGFWSNDYYKMGTTFSNSIDNNIMGIMAWGYPNNRHDISATEHASFTNNTALPGVISLQTESDEFVLWEQKLARNGIVLGPNGSAGTSVVTAPAPSPAPAPAPTTGSTGKLTLDFWSAVYGTSVAAVPVANTPTKTSELTSFEAPSNVADNYGQRIRGYVTAPVSGQYTFWIAADDMAELYLSTSEDPAAKTRIAAADIWTNSREWTKSVAQQSVKITLAAGKRYYIEALMLEGGGGDNLAVGWQLPDGSLERPISSNRISQLGSTTTAPAPVTNQAPVVALATTSATVLLGTAITLTATATDVEGSIARVEFFQGTTKIGESTTSPYVYNWANAAAGSYSVTARATDNAGASTTSAAISISVNTAPTTSNTPAPAPAPTTGSTGKLTLDFWSAVYGTSVAAVPVANTPTKTSELTSFEAPSNVADNYGQRIRGYVTAPVSGQYTFWIAADDMAELYLSTSEDPAAKTRIAAADIWTNSREWTKSVAQQSVKITLAAGKRYYIEALMLEGGGGDNLAVGWQLPDGSLERPIASNRISQLGSTTTAPAPAPITTTTPAGKITLDFWSNVHGTTVTAVPVNSTPARTSELNLFEAPSGQGRNYGQRIRGYVTAPVSGQYTFWIAADDMAELYLSTSENPATKTRIAYAHSFTKSREWTRSATQQSVKITLEAGKRYYIEALMLQGGGGDNLAVGWQLPDGSLERPIAGNRLSPLSATLASTAAATIESSDVSFTTATAYPNPFKNVITLDLGQDKTELAEVVIVDQAGKVVYKVTDLKLNGTKLEIDLTGVRIAAGMYFLKYTDTVGTTKSIKIIKG